MKEANIKSLLEDQKDKICVIGVGQHYDLFFGTNRYRDIPDKVPASGTVIYEGNGRNYTDSFCIDLNLYATIFSVNSEQEDMQKTLKDQTQELARIRRAIQQLKATEAEAASTSDQQFSIISAESSTDFYRKEGEKETTDV